MATAGAGTLAAMLTVALEVAFAVMAAAAAAANVMTMEGVRRW